MKCTKKLVAFLLAGVLLALSCSAAFAAEQEDVCPIIYVHGFMSGTILADRNDPNSQDITLDAGPILADLKGVLPGLLKSVVLHDWESFGTQAIDLVMPHFSPMFYGDDGAPKDNSGVWFVYPTEVAKDSVLAFHYDYREDPMKTAADLNDFINYVCEKSGAPQVKIEAHSYGGTVFVTYLTLYGNEKIRAAVFDSTAIFGEAYTGDLMTGQIILDAQALEEYLDYSFAGNEYYALISEALQISRKIGLTKLLVKLGDELVDAQKERVMRDLLLPMFANWLSIWAMIPDKDVEAAQHFVFDVLCAGQDRSALRAKIDAYNTQIRPYKAETLKALNEKAPVYVLSRTGYASIPLTPSHANLSDGTVDTKYSSFGATTAPYGGTLSEEALAGKDPAYISPEKDIDASTCLFPEQTWFLYGAKHSGIYDTVETFIDTLLDSPTQITVSTFEQYPRFLRYDISSGSLTPDGGKPAASWLDQVHMILAAIKQVFALLKQAIH